MDNPELKIISVKLQYIEDKAMSEILDRLTLFHERGELVSAIEDMEKQIRDGDSAIEVLAVSFLKPLEVKK